VSVSTVLISEFYYKDCNSVGNHFYMYSLYEEKLTNK
jgi:hypothetical protein